MKKRATLYYTLILVAVGFWGVSFVFTKALLAHLAPIVILFLRLLIATALQAVVCRLFFHQPLRKIPGKDWLYLLMLSLFEPFLYFIFETYSIQYTDPTIVSVIIATIPIFTVLLSFFYFKENLSWLNMAGVAVSVAGIVVMLVPEFGDVTFNPLGIVLAFGAVGTAVGYSFFLKKISDRYNPIFIVTWQNTFGLLFILPVMLLVHGTGDLHRQFAMLADPAVLRDVILLAVFCSALAYTFYITALQRIGLGRANTFTNLIPVVTGLFAFFVLGEPFPPLKIIGAVMAVAGVWCVQAQFKKNKAISFHQK